MEAFLSNNFIKFGAVFLTLFSIFQLVVPNILSSLHPNWWNSLSVKKQREIPPCIIGLFHHFVVVPFAIFTLYKYYLYGIYMTQFEISILAPFSFAYLSVDTVFYALVEAQSGNYEYLVHHILAVWISTALASASSDDMRFLIPNILICELSTIFFAFGWIMRSTSYKSSIYIKHFETLFALSFFITRIVMLPTAVYTTWPKSVEIGLARYTLIPIVGMQFYWFSKIFAAAVGKKKATNHKDPAVVDKSS
jgi:hypothetical protein